MDDNKFPPLPNSESLALEIEEYARVNDCLLLTAAVDVLDKYGVDAEDKPQLLSKPLIAKMEVEAQRENMMRGRDTTHKLF